MGWPSSGRKGFGPMAYWSRDLGCLGNECLSHIRTRIYLVQGASARLDKKSVCQSLRFEQGHIVECEPRRLPADLGSMSDGRHASSGPAETGNGSGCKKRACVWGRKNGLQDVMSSLIDAVCYCVQDLLVADACGGHENHGPGSVAFIQNSGYPRVWRTGKRIVAPIRQPTSYSVSMQP